jgi:hypothetical protein
MRQGLPGSRHVRARVTPGRLDDRSDRTVPASPSDTRLSAVGPGADAVIRLIVVRRLPPKRLTVFAKDPDLRVRVAAAARVEPNALHLFLDDAHASVREIATRRLIAITRRRLASQFDERQ